MALIAPDCGGQWSVLKGDPRALREKPPNLLFQEFTPEEWNASNFAPPQRIEWFRSLRFGVLIQAGLARGQEISWGVCHTRKLPDTGNGPIPDEVWQSWPKEMGLEKFDAKRWVAAAKAAGMRYFVAQAKHHDGFHLWDTALSDFKITNTPFGRDQLKEIADACHQAGMPFGIYFAQREWYHPDYCPVDPRTGKPGPMHAKYLDYLFKAVRELCTNYGKVDIFWFDAAWWGGMFNAGAWDAERLTRMIRELQPGILINNRVGLPGDFDTPEQRIGMFQNDRAWESVAPLGLTTWAWSEGGTKSKRQLVRELVSCAIGDGNLLLGMGAHWDGEMDPAQVARLKEVGDWLNVHGGSIYGTRGGPWMPGIWGGSTQRGHKVWLHVLNFDGETLKFPVCPRKILDARILGSSGKVRVSQTSQDVIIVVARKDQDAIDTVIELTLDGQVKGTIRDTGRQTIFSGPSYGTVISETATMEISSSGPSDTAALHSRLLAGEPVADKAFETAQAAPYAFMHSRARTEQRHAVKALDQHRKEHGC
jgi:alpha-L-fucosidase